MVRKMYMLTINIFSYFMYNELEKLNHIKDIAKNSPFSRSKKK